MIDFNQVVTFVEAVRQGSFSAAARTLEIPRSTVSARMQALEQSLDARLMRRTTRRNALTDEGRAFYDSVAAAVDAMRTAAAGVHGAHGALSGVVRLTAPPEYPLQIISAALATFHAIHPRVGVEIMLTNQAVGFVDERVDLAIRGGPGGNAGLISIRLPDIAFGLYGSRNTSRSTVARGASLSSAIIACCGSRIGIDDACSAYPKRCRTRGNAPILRWRRTA